MKRPVPAALAALVLTRSTVFVLWPASHFDSDQAVPQRVRDERYNHPCCLYQASVRPMPSRSETDGA